MNTSSLHQEIDRIDSEQDINSLFALQDGYDRMYEGNAIDTPTHTELAAALVGRQEAISKEMRTYYE